MRFFRVKVDNRHPFICKVKDEYFDDFRFFVKSLDGVRYACEVTGKEALDFIFANEELISTLKSIGHEDIVNQLRIIDDVVTMDYNKSIGMFFAADPNYSGLLY